ncbi:MAG: hypothetical protein E7079_04230 [Bacteroidales bacterium]|nr:hypothetical protein [Bacteroidales bacterium]
MAVKGKTNNPNGRPKGSKNKVTTEVRDWISKVIDKQRPQLEKDLKLLEPAERWRIIEKLMSYVVPKMQAVEANVNLNKLSDEDLDKLASNIIKASEEVTDEN